METRTISHTRRRCTDVTVRIWTMQQSEYYRVGTLILNFLLPHFLPSPLRPFLCTCRATQQEVEGQSHCAQGGFEQGHAPAGRYGRGTSFLFFPSGARNCASRPVRSSSCRVTRTTRSIIAYVPIERRKYTDLCSIQSPHYRGIRWCDVLCTKYILCT